LASGKLELSTTNGLNDMGLAGVLGTDTQQDLSNIDTGSHTNGLTVRVAHSGGQTIGSGTRKHFIGTKDMERVGAHANVKGVLMVQSKKARG
jgi:hypothetical protein